MAFNVMKITFSELLVRGKPFFCQPHGGQISGRLNCVWRSVLGASKPIGRLSKYEMFPQPSTLTTVKNHRGIWTSLRMGQLLNLSIARMRLWQKI